MLSDHACAYIADGSLRTEARKLIAQRYFCPSGRILQTASLERTPIAPNCCVLPWDDFDMRQKCLDCTTGVGSSLASAPSLEILHKLNAQPHLEKDGRMAGLMYTLPAESPLLNDFLALKNSAKALTDPIFRRANHSVVVNPHQIQKWLGSDDGMRTAQNALKCGEPGLILSENPQQATAPCGELHMDPYEACVLGNINLAKILGDSVDGQTLRWSVRIGAEILDILREHLDLPTEMRIVVNERRRIGLGVMGWATALGQQGIRYDSMHALGIADEIGGIMMSSAPPGHASVLAFPPTGRTARLMEVSESIEPFAWEAPSIHWTWHVRMLAKWQKHVDNGISKTINLPQTAGAHDVIAAWRLAAALGCKGATVFKECESCGFQ